MNKVSSLPKIMGILNTTPDSFSDGGKYVSLDTGLAQVEKMVLAGADIVDVGGESTRPGAAPVSVEEEINRVVPLIEAVKSQFDIPVSIDTSKAEVMRAAVNAGASMINDVRALREPGALEAAAELQADVCLMHMQGEPRTMQANPEYKDVVEDVCQFLDERVSACVEAGICKEKITIDPGFGFGKSLAHNLTLLRELQSFKSMGLPILVGVSRKSMFGAILDKPADERVAGSVAAATIAAWLGADVLRVHDVGETLDALKVCCAIKTGEMCG